MRRVDPWALMAWLLVLAALALVLTGEAIDPAPTPPSAQERAARVAAQEAYYDTLDRYGDLEGAVEVARMAYEMEVGCSGK